MNDGMLDSTQIPWAAPPRGDATPGPLTLGGILQDLRSFIGRYVVLTPDQASTIAVWAAHTHVLGAFECTLYLQVTSATARAGKTRLLEVLERVVARPWLTGRMSAAVLVRKVDAEKPTLLLDESDAAFRGEKEYAEALRGILNTGYRASGKASLCVGQGANISYKNFSTFSAKAIAGIGELPDTIGDRAIRIELRRRMKDEPCARWRERGGTVEAEPIHQALVAWAALAETEQVLAHARPTFPNGLSDRQEDCWEPLFAVADLAGGEWPTAVRGAAIALAGAIEDYQDIAIELLKDIAAILPVSKHHIVPTKDIISQLVEQDDRPWASWKHDKPITARGLARLLGPLGIHPTRLEHVRGYRVDAFTDAIARYLPVEASVRQEPSKNAGELPIMTCQTPRSSDASKNAIQADLRWRNDAMTDEQAAIRDSDDGNF